MRNKLLNVVTLTLLSAAGVGSAHADTSFGANSLILPASATYQSDCGAVAIYGAVYNVLRANAWLQSKGYGTIEVYYAYKDTKTSPNRCTPTNLNAGPTYSAGVAPGPVYPASGSPVLHSDAKWNDGCDFEIVSPVVVPVKLVNNTTAVTSLPVISEAASFNTIDTSGKATVFPKWPAKTIIHTTVASTNVTTVRYWGGAYIIDDQDAPVFLRLIQGTGTNGLIAQDSDGNNIDFSMFKSGACSYGTTVGGAINIHRAQANFTAPTPKVFNKAPPRLALLASNANQAPFDGNTYTTAPGTNSFTGRVADKILQSYLSRAGLTFAGAQGCPVGGYLATSYSALCPSPAKVGQIFDLFDFRDIVSGRLNDSSGTPAAPTYKMLWAPHWEINAGTPSANEIAGISNIASYLDQQRGLMAQCASVEALEGVQTGWLAPSAANALGELQVCKGSGTCTTSVAPIYGLAKNSGTTAPATLTAGPAGTFGNCTDPNLSSGAQCFYYGYPGDPYSQVAEYMWDSDAYTIGSHVADFKPNTGYMYRPGVLALISGVNSLDKSKLATPALARGMISGDLATRNYKGGSTSKSAIVYLANHDLSSSVAGTKVVLQTLLQLGDSVVSPATLEVTRSSPIIAPISGTTALVQGTFERVTPAATTLTANSAAELLTFRFPDIKGHLRAIDLAQVDASATDFASQTGVIFDAATRIPATASSYAGCGTQAFKGTCRTIFTHTVAGANPPRLLFESTNVNTIGAAIGAGSTLATTDYPVLLQRIIAGIETAPSSNVYVAKLGGVDRSTVAIIPASLVAGTSRPTMIYFGATDGMLHAVCGSVDNTKGCDVVGRELWAFVPRLELSALRKNTGRVDGSPRVLDMFGDFTGTGIRTFKTILMFQTANKDSTLATQKPSTTALDITDPNDPKIIWDVSAPASPGVTAMGQGLVVAAGKVYVNNTYKNAAFIQTNNGGTGLAGNVVTAVNVDDGTQLWQTGYAFVNPPRGSGLAVPTGGIPGGAVVVDKTGAGSVTDVVFGTLYGDLWQLDATTGTSRHGSNPLFRNTANLHPFGAPPTIYSNGGTVFAVAIPGAYVDQGAASLWTTSAQTGVGVSLSTPVASAPLSETSGATYVPLKFPLLAGDKTFSQAVVVGGELFVTADALDINSLTYGTLAGDTGHVYKVNLGTGASTTVLVAGGGGGVGVDGTNVYTGAKTSSQQISTTAASTAGEQVNKDLAGTVTRRLWLRTL